MNRTLRNVIAVLIGLVATYIVPWRGWVAGSGQRCQGEMGALR
jgi:hypothetical protein